MKPVMQTRDGWPHGNCLMAALASILEVPLDSLPDLYDEGSRRGDPEVWWWGVFLETCRAHGVECFYTPARGPGVPAGYPPGYAIASIPSPGVPGHAVVALNGKIVHDPHPLRPSKGMSRRSVRGWYVLTPIARAA